jgi:WD40 repeat protein/serine/threonine protein kinase
LKTELLTMERFLEQLRASNLLSAENLARTVERTAHEDYHEPGPLAWWLVEQKLATRWQAHMLVSGRNRFSFGKYKLLDRIGVGGMGTVYKAWQPGLGREVALKVLSDSMVGNEGAASRFHREIQSAASLTHPNIVATFDAGSVGGKHFLVMEYVDGENLETLARRRGPLPVAEACEYIRQAAVGLAHAHSLGMVHRDIKPANLLLSIPSKSGTQKPGARTADETALPVVKILDFGLARLATETQGESELTQTGQVMGTPDYIAPEQARDTRTADFRSDVYSLGCTLFRLLTGRVPFVRQSVMEKLLARALEDAPRARSLRQDLPPALDDCIARMLARDPAQRFQTAGDVVQTLDGLAATGGNIAVALPVNATIAPPVLSGAAQLYDPVSAPDAELEQFLAVLADQADSASALGGLSGDTSRAALATGSTNIETPRRAHTAPAGDAQRTSSTSQRPVGRRPPLAKLPLIVACALLLPMAGIVLWYVAGGTRLDIDWPADERKGGALEIDGREPILSGPLSFSGRPGKRKLKLTRTGYQPIERQIVLERGAVETFRPEWVPTPQTLRRQQWSVLKAEAEQWKPSDGRATGTDYQPIDALRAKIDEFRRNWLMTREAGQAANLLRRLPAPADRLTHAMVSGYELRAAGAGKPENAPSDLVAVIGDSRWKHGSRIEAIAYSPDDSMVAAGGDFGFLKLWDAQTGEEIAAVKASESPIMALAFSPDGKSLITGGIDGVGRIWNVPQLTVAQTLKSHISQIRGAAYSPLGNLVATGALDPSVRLWNPTDGSLAREITQGVAEVACVAFSPDEKLLAVGYHNPYSASIFAVETGKLVATLEGHTSSILTVAFNPAGTRLITSGYDATIRCWDVGTWQELRAMTGVNRNGVTSIRYSPDGKTIAAGIGDGRVDFYDAESGFFQKTLTCDDQGAATLSFSHDGKRLAIAGSGQAVRIWDLITQTEIDHPAVPILCFAASPDGRWLALGKSDGSVDMWDVAAGMSHSSLGGTAHRVGEIAFSPDGLLLATAGDTGESAIRVWDVASGEVKHVLQGHRASVAGVVFSPDGLTLASASHDGAVRLWNMESGGLVQTLEAKGPPPICAAFSADGKTLAVGHVRDSVTIPAVTPVKLWDVARGKEQKPIIVEWAEASHVGFGLDDQTLVVGGRSQGVKLWDLTRGSARSTFTGSGAFAVSSDGTHVAVDEKTAIHVYEIAHGIRTAELSLSRPDVWSTQLAFTPETRHLAVLASNGTVHVLRLPKE